MKEEFYIQLELIKQEQRRFKESIKYDPPLSLNEKLNHSGFEPMSFPSRECKPVTRRRTRKEIQKLIGYYT